MEEGKGGGPYTGGRYEEAKLEKQEGYIMLEEKKDQVLGQAEALDSRELEDAAGGKACGCFLGGGGESDKSGEKTCVCVLGGGGEYNSEGEKEHDRKMRCYCVGPGGGVE